MATRGIFLVVIVATFTGTILGQRVSPDTATPSGPEITAPWTASDASGVDYAKLRALQDPSFVHFDGHYSGTSAITGTCTLGQTIELWGEGAASVLGASTIGYSWCFDPVSGERMSVPDGEITNDGSTLHFIVLEERPDAYHTTMLYQRGIIASGTGDFVGASGAWDATLRIFRNSDGTFEWLMHIYGWLDVGRVQM